MKNGGHFAFWPGGASKQFLKILKKIPVLYIHIWHTFYPLPFEITNFDFLAPLYAYGKKNFYLLESHECRTL